LFEHSFDRFGEGLGVAIGVGIKSDAVGYVQVTPPGSLNFMGNVNFIGMKLFWGVDDETITYLFA
jgi:hypothetical protein